MSPLLRIQVDTEQLTDEAFDFVTDPTPARNERRIVHELNDIYPEMVDVLECMVIDGTEQRQDVSDYVHAVFTPEGYRSPHAPARPEPRR